MQKKFQNYQMIFEKVVPLQPIKPRVMEDKSYFKQFDVEFVKLPLGKHGFECKVDKTFFEKHTNDEISDADVKVSLQVEKLETLMYFRFHIEGDITLKCDLCLDNLHFPVDTAEDFVLKKAHRDEVPTEDENMIYLEPDAYSYNIEQIVYELIYASVPMRKVHSDYPGQQCNQEMLDLLEAHQQKEEEEKECDPRWEALKNIKL